MMGSDHVRRKTLTKNSAAHTRAMTTRMFLAGSSACASVYCSPVISRPSCTASS